MVGEVGNRLVLTPGDAHGLDNQQRLDPTVASVGCRACTKLS